MGKGVQQNRKTAKLNQTDQLALEFCSLRYNISTGINLENLYIHRYWF